MSTSINHIANEIVNELRRYTNLVVEEVEVAKKDVAKETVKQLKQTSPKLTGDYQKGWTSKKEKDAVIIHNKTDYQLTHLLEHGHAIANGTGRVPAYPHIAQAEEKAVREFTERVERAIRP